MEEIRSKNEFKNFFGEPKLMDASGKELTREELIEFMEMRKQQLEKLKDNEYDEMFKNIPRQR